MNVLITGATGFIGSHITQALLDAGYQVTACIRDMQLVQQRWPRIQTVRADFTSDHNTAIWLPRLTNIDVVINAVGIIRETGRHTFDALHTKAPCALFEACEEAGVKKVIQISALGTDETAFSQYHLSKRAADEYLMSLNLNWTILLPSIVYGPNAKSTAFFKAVAALPVIPLVDKGNQPVQPIHINDLTRAIVMLLEQQDLKRQRIEMVGPTALSMKSIHAQLRQWLGMGPATFLYVPYHLSLHAARLGGFLGNTPMNAEAIQMLRRGNTGNCEPFIKQFGFTPMSFQAALAATSAQQSDRWHAHLYFVRPLLRFAIAFLWIFTGIVSAFIFPVEQSYAMLAKAGISGIWAPLMLYGAAATDFVLGVATLTATRLRLVAYLQISIILLYTIIISFSQPEQWVHPFGPVSKNLPLIVATYIIIILEKR
jgi:uncharacterized protein YbjT (DUF2867 family)